MIVSTETQRKIRMSYLNADESEKINQQEIDKKNKCFTQVYSNGWNRLRRIIKQNPAAASLYSFFAEHIDPNCGAVVCDQKFLADKMDVSVRTVQRRLKYLEEQNALVRIPVAGKVCAYALNPHEVWKGYNNAKEYAAFVTKTLVNKDGEIRRRIMSMFSSEQDS